MSLAGSTGIKKAFGMAVYDPGLELALTGGYGMGVVLVTGIDIGYW